jgi:hypothetical protein
MEKTVSSGLARLIEKARAYKMPADERDEQVRSFAYGNIHIENPSITRADIDKAFELSRRAETTEA